MKADNTRHPIMAHILVIEDNPLNMELVRDLLQAYGYRVSEAEDAETCYRCLQQEKPDLILMDLQLPEIDGLSLVQKLKAQPQWQTIPIIALTAYAMTGDRERALACGCDGFITKPIDIHTFRDEIEKSLKFRGNQ